jgi:hypothetical protein
MTCECETHSEVCWQQALLTSRCALGGGAIRADRLWERVILEDGTFFADEIAFLRERRTGQPVFEKRANGAMCYRAPNEYHYSLWRRGDYQEESPMIGNTYKGEPKPKGYYWTRIHTTQDVASIIISAQTELDRLAERDMLTRWTDDY